MWLPIYHHAIPRTWFILIPDRQHPNCSICQWWFAPHQLQGVNRVNMCQPFQVLRRLKTQTEATGVVSFGSTYHGGRNFIGRHLRLVSCSWEAASENHQEALGYGFSSGISWIGWCWWCWSHQNGTTCDELSPADFAIAAITKVFGTTIWSSLQQSSTQLKCLVFWDRQVPRIPGFCVVLMVRTCSFCASRLRFQPKDLGRCGCLSAVKIAYGWESCLSTN